MKTSASESLKALRFMLSYLLLHWRAIAAGAVALVIVDLIQLLIPRIVGETLDSLSRQSFSNLFIIRNGLIIIGIAFAMLVLRFIWRYCFVGGSRKIEREIRNDLFAHLQTLSFSYFNRVKTGDLMALLINDVSAVRMSLGIGLVSLFDTIILGSLSLAFMFSIDVKLTAICILPLPLIIVEMIFFGNIIQKRFHDVQESFSTISAHTQESFSGIRIIKSFLQELHETCAFFEKCDDYVVKNIRLIKIWGFFFPAVTFLASLSTALLYIFGARYAIFHQITLGQFIAFTFYLNTIVWPMMAIGFVFNVFQRGIASTRRIMVLMDEQPQIRDEQVLPIQTIHGAITIRDLTFSYQQHAQPVLKNINLTLPQGSSLGIMGKPGSGKSTLAALLFRLFTVQEGAICIDGTDINRIPLRVLRSAIGYVPQDSFLFSDTITNNIGYGLADAAITAESVERFAKIASVHKEITGFSEGFNTMVGERGITLSGGQKQRVSIARALVVNPKILILDDALSAVDAHTEKEILANIQDEIKKRTSLVIAHRVSTLQKCDRIIVLENGTITEQGTHAELVAKKGYYANLFKLQKLTDDIEEKETADK